jgi:hypothetical protein
VIHHWDFESVYQLSLRAEQEFLANPRRFIYAFLTLSDQDGPFSFLPKAKDNRLGMSEAIQLGNHAYVPDRHQGKGVSAHYVLQNALKWLQESSVQPFFLWVHLMDIHDLTFTSFDMNNQRLLQNEIQDLIQFDAQISESKSHNGSREYAFAMRYVDNQLRWFLQSLKHFSWFQDTLMTITADHGHHQAYWPERFHPDIDEFYDELFHVPLLFVHNSIPPQENSELVSSLDIAPSILEFAGLDKPGSFQGRSLMSVHEQRAHLVMEHAGRGPGNLYYQSFQVSVRSDRWKVVYEHSPLADESTVQLQAIFDLNEDPLEIRNLAHAVSMDSELEDLTSIARRRLGEIARQFVSVHPSPPKLPGLSDAHVMSVKMDEVSFLRSILKEQSQELAEKNQECRQFWEASMDRLQLIQRQSAELVAKSKECQTLYEICEERLKLLQPLDELAKRQALELAAKDHECQTLYEICEERLRLIQPLDELAKRQALELAAKTQECQMLYDTCEERLRLIQILDNSTKDSAQLFHAIKEPSEGSTLQRVFRRLFH